MFFCRGEGKESNSTTNGMKRDAAAPVIAFHKIIASIWVLVRDKANWLGVGKHFNENGGLTLLKPVLQGV